MAYGSAIQYNASGGEYIYIAIRRPDPLVQKPQLATDVFAMATGGSSAAGGSGCFNSGFPVDFATLRTTGSHPWQTSARQMGKRYMPGLNQTNAETDASNFTWDSNTGYMTGNFTGYQSWMWKRHAGFDVVNYSGNGSAGHVIKHNLSKIPQMMWIRRRDSVEDWEVYHKGSNGGTNPQNYGLKLNNTTAEHSNGSARWDAPTATSITVNTDNGTNNSSGTYLMMLFASVDGISKVGNYSGSGSSRTITVGFQPRFIIVKNISRSQGWITFDTVRGWGSGTDAYMWLNDSAAQVTGGFNFGEPTSTGFTLPHGDISSNQSGDNYIYYVHA